MIEFESSLHLYQAPLYRGNGGTWNKSFVDAVADCDGKITWDPAAILGILGFTYTCGDRTLVNEVKRRPWLSEIGLDGKPQLKEIPSHGRKWKTTSQIAEDLCNLLYKEALEMCEKRKEIYLLLSGGLDSRIVAGILGRLYNDGRLATKPVGVTWGLENSRDVVYGREIAQILGFDWIHVGMSHEDLKYNTDEMAIDIGTLVSPVHLHCAHWFKNVSKVALVLAASYGDSVGRAEFSGRSVLELDYLRPVNSFGLIRDEVLAAAYDGVKKDLRFLKNRSADQTKYILCEHEMQGHYMRNMIAHVMSVIGQYCSIYQMFTHPNTYSYMWSIHPALRDDGVYAELLEHLGPRLARMPWARTNRALKGKTVGAKSGLRRNYHERASWISGPLFDELYRYIDPVWFGETGIFDREKIRSLAEKVRHGKGEKGLYGFFAYERWLWLAAFRRMAEHLESLGKSVELDKAAVRSSGSLSYQVPGLKRGVVRSLLSRSDLLYQLVRRYSAPFRKIISRIRKRILQYQAVRRYPPDKVF